MRLRIVGGALKGRYFAGPTGDDVRPTAERVREAMASALVARGALPCRSVLDVFSGTGALAFEAISRGAAVAVCVDKSRGGRGAIMSAARSLGIEAQVRAVSRDAWALEPDAIPERPFELVFADPPYDRASEVPSLLSAWAARGVFAEGAWIVLEHRARDAVVFEDPISEIARYRYGDTAFLLGRFAAVS